MTGRERGLHRNNPAANVHTEAAGVIALSWESRCLPLAPTPQWTSRIAATHCIRHRIGKNRVVANSKGSRLRPSASAKHHGFCACLTFAQVEVGIPICTPAFAISANVVSDTVKSSSSIM